MNDKTHDTSTTKHTTPNDPDPTAEEMEGLTEDEKALLNAAGDDGGDDKDKGGDKDDDAAAAAAGDDEKPAGADLDDLPPIEDGPAEIVSSRADAEVQKWLNTNFDQEFQSIEDEKKALAEKHDNGEISDVELIDAREALAERRAELRDRKKDVELYVERQQDQDRLFAEAHDEFFAEEANKKYLENNLLRGLFASTMDTVARTDEAQNKSYRWLLETTRRQIEQGLRDLRGGAAPAASQGDRKPEENRDRKPDRRAEEAKARDEAGKTLGGLPQADSERGDSKWAHLDDMDITELEHELARMPPREVEAYLREVS